MRASSLRTDLGTAQYGRLMRVWALSEARDSSACGSPGGVRLAQAQ
jgi:hypothetical protein